MWSREYAGEGAASAAAVWRLWADVEGWGEWNADIESVTLAGPFAVGSEITMTPRGANPVALRIVAATPEESFVDEATLDGIVVRTEHLVEPLDGDRVRVTYRTEISGPGADEVGPKIGPAITDDFPETIAALLALAAERG